MTEEKSGDDGREERERRIDRGAKNVQEKKFYTYTHPQEPNYDGYI
jgi:hypothetical protein